MGNRNPADELIRLRQQISLSSGVFPERKIPPKALQVRAAGAYYPKFFQHGLQLGNDLNGLFKKQGTALENAGSILDFGCGCGRILIPLGTKIPPKNVWGTDIDPEAISWCRANLAEFGGFELNPHQPPSPFLESQFDLIYGVSVFTHLPEDMEQGWLEELRRISKPGAHLVLTVHGPHYIDQLEDQGAKALVDEKGFFHAAYDQVTTEGLPAFYQTSFHHHHYIRDRWAAFFDVLDIVPQGVGGTQDAVVLLNSK